MSSTIFNQARMGCVPTKIAPVAMDSPLDTQAIYDEYSSEVHRYLRNTPHVNARSSPYQGGGPKRVKLLDSELSWERELDWYRPPVYDHPILVREPRPFWADPVDVSGIQFNTYDSALGYERKSHEGVFKTNAQNMPLNLRGRCGIAGRGLLGRWGPNHAADPVATRWSRDRLGNKRFDSDGSPILEFVAIKRKDTGEWAIPGGMVDPGENVSLTLKREFGEETMASMELSPEEHRQLMCNLDHVFSDGVLVYSGYVDDIRNTDHAWMETVCVNFHDDSGTAFSKFKLRSGDDAGDVAWKEYRDDIRLYATHAIFLKSIFNMRLAIHHAQQSHQVTNGQSGQW